MLIATTEKGTRLKNEVSDVDSSDVMFAILVDTNRLKEICRVKYFRKKVKGGDSNTSLGVLIKSKDLL